MKTENDAVHEEAEVVGRVFYRLDGTVEYVDDGAKNIFKLGAAVLGKTHTDLDGEWVGIRFLDHDALERRVQRMLEGRPEPGQFDIERDGEYVTLAVDYEPVMEGTDTVGFVATYYDVTESSRNLGSHSEPSLRPKWIKGFLAANNKASVYVDSDLNCHYANQALLDVFRVLDPSGKSVSFLLKAARFPDPESVMHDVKAAIDGAEPKPTEHVLMHTGADSSIEVSISPVPGGAVLFVEDSKRTARLHQVELLAELGRLGAEELSLETLGQAIVDRLFDWMPVDTGVIGIFEGERLQPFGWRGLLLDASMVADPLVNPYVIQALDSGEPTFGDGGEWEGAPLTGTHVVVPLHYQGRAIGTLHLGVLREANVDQLDFEFLRELSDYIAATLEGTRRRNRYAAERARLEALVQRMPEGVVLFNNRGEILLSNEGLKDILEVDLKHLNLDRRPYRVLDLDGTALPRAEWPFFRAARMRAGYVDVRIIVEFDDGRRKYVEVNVLPIASNDGPAESFLGTLEDITARVVQDQRKDEFLSVASHELRSPLTPLTGFLQLLQRQLERGESIDETLVARSLDQVRRLSRLIDVLLDMTRIETGRMVLHMETVDLCEVVERVCAAWDAHPKGVEVRTLFPDGPVIATLDSGRMDQVLTNLIDNAVKHTDAGSKVSVTVAHSQNSASIVIEDEGAGIETAHLSRVFDRFYQAERARADSRSMGLGLYISQQILQHHGGIIDISSELGVGTKVSITIPLETH